MQTCCCYCLRQSRCILAIDKLFKMYVYVCSQPNCTGVQRADPVPIQWGQPKTNKHAAAVA
jgi:hypothetical protein